MSELPLRVIKVGGSLLEWENLKPALHEFLSSQSPARQVLVVGGGQLVENLRRYDRLHELDANAVHWSAVKMMSATAEVVASLLGGCPVVSRLKDVASMPWPGPTVVLEPYPFLRFDEPDLPGGCLAQSWDVTSDSIAARLAEVTRAQQLVLLKSALPEDADSWQTAADIGYVDPCFPVVVSRVPCAICVNLKDPSMSVWRPLDSGRL